MSIPADLMELHTVDVRAETLRLQLAAVPREVDEVLQRQQTARQKLEDLRQRLRQLEVQRSTLEGEIRALEEKIVKYKTQQMEVRKQEEYLAFEHEIATARAAISEREDKELSVLLELDEAKPGLARLEAETKLLLAEGDTALARLREKETTVRAELAGADTQVAALTGKVEGKWLRPYQFARKQVKRGPWIVAVVDQKCGGCHLRVSNEALTGLRKATDPQRCDQCNRLLYLS